MKKTLLILLALTLSVVFISCGGDSATEPINVTVDWDGLVKTEAVPDDTTTPDVDETVAEVKLTSAFEATDAKDLLEKLEAEVKLASAYDATSTYTFEIQADDNYAEAAILKTDTVLVEGKDFTVKVVITPAAAN